MPRKNRKLYPGAIYHVFDRGVAKQPIFIDDRDRKFFLEIIEELHLAYNFVVHAYCLMGNHYHILLQTFQSNLPQIMQRFMCKYAKHFNTKYKRPGYLFQDRYDDRNVYTEQYFATLFRYLALNPVIDRNQREPQDYVWASYYDYFHEEQRYQFLTKDLFHNLFDKYKMDSESVHQYVLCSEEELKVNYQFDDQMFHINDFQSKVNVLDSEDRQKMIFEMIDTVDLSDSQRKQYLAFLIKRYTTLPDRVIAGLTGYKSVTSLSKLYKRINSRLESSRLLRYMVKRLEDKFRIPGIRN